MAIKESKYMYPISPKEGNWEQELGMTKREYFAAKAMQGYVTGEHTAQAGMSFENMAKWSVEMADALLEALAKKKKI